MAQNLVLNGTVKTLAKTDWDVHFVTDPVPTMNPTLSIDHDGVFEQEINLEMLTGTFSVTLAPGASIDYNVQVVNEGKLHAIADGAPVITGETSNITCTVTPVTSTELFTESGVTAGPDEYKITIACADMDDLPDEPESASIKVTFKYKQAHE